MLGKLAKKIKYELQFKNPHYFTRLSDFVLKRTYTRILKKRVGSLTPITLNHRDAELTLAILANKKRFYESVAALYSFCVWDNNVYVHYHEDGSLSVDDIALLKKVFRGITVFIQSEQTLKIKDYLLSKNLVYAAQLRGAFLFSVKLLDEIIEKKTPYLLHIDSDVLFFSRPDEILDVVKNSNYNCCFNVDNVDSYTFGSDTVARYINAPLVSRLNSGLFLHNFNEDFFAFIDNVMKNEPDAVVSWHLEQTLFAMYASALGGYLPLPPYYDVTRAEKNLGHKIVSEHYCHNTGYNFHKDFIYKIYPAFLNKAIKS